ncbi:MAG: hypothetical protein AAF438_05270, partial [Pseudomonadota bacterium]
ALRFNTAGSLNTATGFFALADNKANGNTATGARAMENNSTGAANTALGAEALRFNDTGATNTAVGSNALVNNVVGSSNTAVGFGALNDNLGSNNIAIGRSAGRVLANDSDNIMIGNEGVTGDSGTIRLGEAGTHTATYVAGIQNTDLSATGTPVVIDANGQLGVGSPSGGGLSGFNRVTQSCNYVLAPDGTGVGNATNCDAVCPSGQTVISGGYTHTPQFSFYADEVLVIQNYASSEGVWRVRVVIANTTGGNRAGTVVTQAMCVDN